MAIQKFFDHPDVVAQLTAASDAMYLRHEDRFIHTLGQMLRQIAATPAAFDQYCQINVQTAGKKLMEEIAKLTLPGVIDNHQFVASIVYRFLVEYDMSVPGELSMEVRDFMGQVEAGEPTMSGEAKAQIRFVRNGMAVAILKNMLNNAEFGNLRNISSVSTSVEQRITTWEGQLVKSEANADRLGALLEKQTAAFNFVGLHEGFSDLSKNIVGELRTARIGIGIFGFLVLLPGMFDVWLALGVHKDFLAIPAQTLVAAGIGTLTLTLLCLYFFRIALRKADSCRAQLMQVRLRMSLCKFIQSYATYSKGIRENNPDALSKFEALIFSGIVSTDDKLPSTFDGIEQLSALAKSIRG